MTVDRSFGLAFIVFAAGMFLAVHGVEATFAGMGDPGLKLLPYLLAAGMAVIGFLLVIRLGAAPASASSDTEPDTAGSSVMLDPQALTVRTALAVALVAYVALFERLGFTPATFLLLAFGMIVLGPRTLRGALISIGLAALLTIAVGGFLTGLIGIPLPGVWML